MEPVPSTIGFPPLDFSLVGLADCPGHKWVEFFQGKWERGVAKPVWSVLALAAAVTGAESFSARPSPG
jgi:hypothetical protein